MTSPIRAPAAVDIDPGAFRAALRQLAGAVSVVATGHGTGRAGLTATSVTSLSADPPTILVSVNRSASAYPSLVGEGAFTVNILADHQQAIADRFAGRDGLRGEARFEGAEWSVLATDAPALSDALAVLDCEVEEIIERHSHAIMIGRVKAARIGAGVGALVYWRGIYEILPGAPHAAEGI